MNTAVLFVSATAEEAAALPDDVAQLVTGVGTVAAAASLGCHLALTPKASWPALIINLGTAGGLCPGMSGIYTVSRAVKHDFDAETISAIVGHRVMASVPLTPAPGLPAVTLATGDSFISTTEKRDCLARVASLCDMEGYAIAMVAKKLGIRCVAVKQVSDKADESAARTWAESVAVGAPALAAEALRVAQVMVE